MPVAGEPARPCAVRDRLPARTARRRGRTARASTTSTSARSADQDAPAPGRSIGRPSAPAGRRPARRPSRASRPALADPVPEQRRQPDRAARAGPVDGAPRRSRRRPAAEAAPFTASSPRSRPTSSRLPPTCASSGTGSGTATPRTRSSPPAAARARHDARSSTRPAHLTQARAARRDGRPEPRARVLPRRRGGVAAHSLRSRPHRGEELGQPARLRRAAHVLPGAGPLAPRGATAVLRETVVDPARRLCLPAPAPVMVVPFGVAERSRDVAARRDLDPVRLPRGDVHGRGGADDLFDDASPHKVELVPPARRGPASPKSPGPTRAACPRRPASPGSRPTSTCAAVSSWTAWSSL